MVRRRSRCGKSIKNSPVSSSSLFLIWLDGLEKKQFEWLLSTLEPNAYFRLDLSQRLAKPATDVDFSRSLKNLGPILMLPGDFTLKIMANQLLQLRALLNRRLSEEAVKFAGWRRKARI